VIFQPIEVCDGNMDACISLFTTNLLYGVKVAEHALEQVNQHFSLGRADAFK
jgi:hypothetical protein